MIEFSVCFTTSFGIKVGRWLGEEEEEHVGPSKTPVTKGPPSKRAAREKDAPAAEVPAKRRLVRRYTPRKTDDEVEEEEGVEPARDAVTTPSPVKRPAKTYGSSKSKRTPRGHGNALVRGVRTALFPRIRIVEGEMSLENIAHPY